MMWPNPLVLYAAGGALLIGSVAGYKIRDWQCDAAQANALENAAEQGQEMQDEVDTQATDYEAVRTETYGVGTRVEREVRTIYREVPAPPADCAPPSAAVGLLQGRVDHANASASGEPSE
jgi:hypothetical protein